MAQLQICRICEQVIDPQSEDDFVITNSGEELHAECYTSEMAEKEKKVKKVS